jgi:hypothetical protein
MTSELISLIANLALVLSFIVALVFGVAQVRAAKRDRRERLTVEILRNFQTHEFSELMHFMITRDIPKSREEMLNLPINEQVILFQFAQQMESLGILVAEGLINIDLVDKTLGSFVVTSWEKNKSLMMDARAKATDPFTSEYFQWLAEQTEKRARENPRKPAYEVNKPAPGTSLH